MFIIADAIEIAQDSLDNVWKITQFAVYPDVRMENLLKVFGQALQDYITSQFAGVNVWTESFSALRESLKKVVQMAQNWITVTDTLTTKLWKGTNGVNL